MGIVQRLHRERERETLKTYACKKEREGRLKRRENTRPSVGENKAKDEREREREVGMTHM